MDKTAIACYVVHYSVEHTAILDSFCGFAETPPFPSRDLPFNTTDCVTRSLSKRRVSMCNVSRETNRGAMWLTAYLYPVPVYVYFRKRNKGRLIVYFLIEQHGEGVQPIRLRRLIRVSGQSPVAACRARAIRSDTAHALPSCFSLARNLTYY